MFKLETATSIRNGSKKKDWFEGTSTYGQDLEVFNLLVMAQSQYKCLWITLAVTEEEQPVEWETSNWLLILFKSKCISHVWAHM